jgi:hypothetical protein
MLEFSLIYLILSMLITFLLLLALYPKQKRIMKYPDINNPISDLYIDENDICYKYHREEYKL